MKYEVMVHTSMHEEYPPGMVIYVDHLEEYLHTSRLQWADVTLSNGVIRSVLITMNNTIQVESEEFISPDGRIKLSGAKPGTWKVIQVGSAKMYLHDRLSVEVASTLSIWEDLPDTCRPVKITRDENYNIVGIAIK